MDTINRHSDNWLELAEYIIYKKMILSIIRFQTYNRNPNLKQQWSHHREIALQREKLRLSKNVYSSCLLKAIRNLGQVNLIFHTAQGNLFYVLLKNKDIEQITTAVWLIKYFLISKMV